MLGRIDILINNADIALQSPIASADLAVAESEMQINYFGMFHVTQAVLPGMLAQCGGQVVNVASTLAKAPGPTQGNYSVSKPALVAFSTALRSEVEEHASRRKSFEIQQDQRAVVFEGAGRCEVTK